MNLADLEILALDYQTTGANPAKGCLLEIGWVQTRAAVTVRPQDLAVKSYPVSLPPEVEIPKAVQRVTGISKETFGKTLPFLSTDIWQKIVKTARCIAAADHMERCPAIIHYARFEAPFLWNLHAESKRRGEFPLHLICTHEIAKRLLPGLPRKGLRAVAGYYGHSVPPSRRSADHAVATAVIWHNGLQNPTKNELLKIEYAILGVPETYAPEPDCLAEGLVLFRRNHLKRLAHPSALRIITGLGRELWQGRLAALENAELETGEDAVDAEPVDQEPEPEEAPSWTPETVARGIEKFTMRSALLIRRARWLCLLSESSLAWEARGSDGRRKIVLLFENGIAAHREELPGEAEVPLSTGYAKLIANRQKIFDLTTYERLRVVTTELRRLVAAGRKVEIRLRPNATLSRRQLARMLPWV
jgi:DNA polymerase III epsilon subunit-like protein